MARDTVEDDALFADLDAPLHPEQERMVEALLFATAEPLTTEAIAARLPEGCDVARALTVLVDRYSGRGVQLCEVANGWAFRTASDLAFLMRQERVETRKLSRAAIETLAIIAYHQPVTRAEIEEIRGVSVSRGTIDILLEQDWIRIGRRRMTPGRPVTFVVTEEFLDHFGLESARDLPGIRELRDAGLLDNAPSPVSTGLAGTDDDPDGLAIGDDPADHEDETPLL